MSRPAKLQFRVPHALSRDDTGATAVEYDLIIALVATVIVAAVTALRG